MFLVVRATVSLVWVVAAVQRPVGGHLSAPALQSRLTLGQPVQVGPVSIVPIESDVPIAKDKYLTLAEATKLGVVEIVEMPGEEQVNELEVRNRSSLPILLFAGELLLGGKQDRIVAHDSIVPAHERRNVEVFCVEHGRWEGKPVFSGGDTIVPEPVRKAAVSSEDQSVVWATVAKTNQSVSASPSTGTLQGTLNSPRVKAESSRLLADLKSRFKATTKTVGTICVINGKIESADIYANAGLFAASKSKLFHSYALDGSLASNKAHGGVDMKKCNAFLREIMSAKRQKANSGRDGLTYSVNGLDVSGYESGTRRFGGGLSGHANGAVQLGGAGFGHGNYRPGNGGN